MMGARQMALELPVRTALGRADFMVAGSNWLALESIDLWPNWPGGKLALVGPRSSGKTHLAHVWAGQAQAGIVGAQSLAGQSMPEPGSALVVEDVDRLADLPDAQRSEAERALFHIHNALTNFGGSLLLTGVDAPARWKIRLPDLASRLAVAPVAALEAPDDALLAAVMVKQFTDRQLVVAPDLISYLLARLDRSFASANAMVARLDHEGLARGRAVTARFAGELLRDEVGFDD